MLFDMESTDLKSNLSNEWSHSNSNSPQQEVEKNQEAISWMKDNNDINTESIHRTSTFFIEW